MRFMITAVCFGVSLRRVPTSPVKLFVHSTTAQRGHLPSWRRCTAVSVEAQVCGSPTSTPIESEHSKQRHPYQDALHALRRTSGYTDLGTNYTHRPARHDLHTRLFLWHYWTQSKIFAASTSPAPLWEEHALLLSTSW